MCQLTKQLDQKALPVLKSTRNLADKLGAGTVARYGRTGCAGVPSIPNAWSSSIVAAESVVKHNSVVNKMFVDVIAGTDQISRGKTPAGRIRRLIYDICRDFRSRKEPDFDKVRRPLHCIDSTTDGIETRTITSVSRVGHPTTNTVAAPLIVCTILSFQYACFRVGVACNGEVGTGMQAH